MERRQEESSTTNAFELLSALGSVLATLAVIAWLISLPNSVTPEQQARRQTKILAYSLWQVELNRKANGRGPPDFLGRDLASTSARVGQIGQDPWGNSYHYTFYKDRELLLLWSSGPNGVNDSTKSLPTFGADDLGTVLDFKMK